MPEIDDHLDRESVYREFRQITDSTLTQSSVLGVLNETLPAEAVIVAAAGSLPGDLQRVWRNRAENTYHVEYGYSCMGYEVNAALGVKLAQPQSEVYSLVGDGSFMMLHSELVTSPAGAGEDQRRAIRQHGQRLHQQPADGARDGQLRHRVPLPSAGNRPAAGRPGAGGLRHHRRWLRLQNLARHYPRTNCATRWTPPVAKRSAL